MTRPIIHDPGSPPYERARALLAKELKALDMKEQAHLLNRGELYRIPPWIAMQIIARFL